jgi:hypothetical protein
MAKVKLNPILEGLHGKLGELVFRRYADEVVVARAPDTGNAEPTPAQAAHRERFRLAVLYGKAVLADPETKTLYETTAKAKGTPAFALAVGDFLNAPAVDEIDLSGYTGQAGQKIAIRAHDDFALAGVAVALRKADGAVLEQGPAALGSDSVWAYTTTTALPAGQTVMIEVTATDRPGHKTTKAQPTQHNA